MQDDPADDPRQRASARIADAQKLISRGRFEEALKPLNEAIAIAPDHPLAYATRAEVFDALGLVPQAQADRERERRLAATVGYPEPEDEAAAQTPIATRKPAIDRSPRRSLFSDGLGSLVLTVLLIGGAIAAVIGGAVIALQAFEDDGDTSSVSSPVTDTPAPDPTGTPALTKVPTPPPSASSSGSPYSLSSVQSAWSAAGFPATIGETADDFPGFTLSPTNVTLDDGSAQFAVLVYEDLDAPRADWDLSVGQRPSPKSGRTVPDHFSIWWNANIIVVVRSIEGGASSATLDALLNMTP
jgi:hypothetical protein